MILFIKKIAIAKGRYLSGEGFTLIELVMIIVILSILAVLAIPKYYNLQDDAQVSAEKSVVGGVRSAIHLYFVENRDWPSQLDNVASGSTASDEIPFFTNVLAQGGIMSGWSKNRAGRYVGPAGTVYTYDNSDGTFDEFTLAAASPVPLER